jgi:TolA-binding protein
MRFVVASSLLAALVLTAPLSPARAQVDSREGIALQNQIYQLRQELKSMEDQAARGGGSGSRAPAYAPAPQSGPNELVTQLLTRVDALEEQVRQLRGQIDEANNQQHQLSDDLNKKIDDLAFQMQTPGKPGAATATVPAPPNLPQPAAARPAAPRPAEAMLQEGNAALARRDFTAAEASAREVLANRTSPRAYDAQFLLAQALSGQKQFPRAAVAYDDVYNRARTGPHAQDARLGLAYALTAINEKKAACDVLSRMPAEFPHMRPDVIAGVSATSARAGCRG